jgi:uncharacterized protein
MRLPLLRLLIVGIVLQAPAANAQQALVCGLADKAVCVDAGIRAGEAERLALLAQLEAHVPEHPYLAAEDEWLSTVKSCGVDIDCYSTAYLNHNQKLRLEITALTGAPPLATAEEVQEIQTEPPLLSDAAESAQKAPTNSRVDAPVTAEQRLNPKLIAAALGTGLVIFLLLAVRLNRRSARPRELHLEDTEAKERAYFERIKRESDEIARQREHKEAEELRAAARARAAEAARLRAATDQIVADAAAGRPLPFAKWIVQQTKADIFGTGLPALLQRLDREYGGRDVVDALFARGIQHATITLDLEKAKAAMPETLFEEFRTSLMSRIERERAHELEDERLRQARHAQEAQDARERERDARDRERERREIERDHAESIRASRREAVARDLAEAHRSLQYARKEQSEVSIRMWTRKIGQLQAELDGLG